MALHRLARVVVGVPNLHETADYYSDFGLSRLSDGDSVSSSDCEVARFATLDGGEQLNLIQAPQRRVEEIHIGVDDEDDLGRVHAALGRLDVQSHRSETSISAVDPGTRIRVVLAITGRINTSSWQGPPLAHNAPGSPVRITERSQAVLRQNPVRPRKLGHVVVGSTSQPTSVRFFVEGLGFKVSDSVRGRADFLRCSTDHHNVLIQAAPTQFLHHTSWQVDDVDEVGRGATAMLEQDPSRHVWGLGRHHIGSNFFWYLRDPAGNFSEYYSDLDCIVDDQLWSPGTWEGKLGLYNWGPPPPASFLKPDDLAALMTGAHNSP